MADSFTDTVEQAERALEGGDLAGAKAILASSDPRIQSDADLHLRAALVSEAAGDFERAVLEYNLALREQPDHAEALRRLGRLRWDQGRLDRATRTFQRLAAIAPGDASVWLDLGMLLEQQSQANEALEVYRRGAASCEDPALDRAAERLAAALAAGSGQAGDPEGAFLEPMDADCIQLVSLFSGREGVHARQWAAQGDRCGYSPIREPFTPAVARKHLVGEITVGVYPVRLDQTTRFLAFDVDIARFAQAQSTAGGSERMQRLSHEVAVAIARCCEAAGLPAYIEDSGLKGRHVWILFATPIPAQAARQLGQRILESVPALPPGITVELFPKQGRVESGGLGNLIKLPLGIHRRNGRRSRFLEASGIPVADQLTYLRTMRTTGRHQALIALHDAFPPREFVLAVSREPPTDPSSQASVAAPGAPGPQDSAALTDSFEAADGGAAPELAWDPDSESAPLPATGQAGPAPEFDYRQDDELLWILQGCPTLAEVVRRAEHQIPLSGPERSTLAYTLGHLTHGPDVVNGLLRQTFSARPEEFLKSRLRGNPMSCPKIRSKVPDIAAGTGCECLFDPSAGGYPTPLLLLEELRSRTGRGPGSASLASLQVDRMVADLVRLRWDEMRLTRSRAAIEARLRGVMAELEIASVETRSGTVTVDGEGRLNLSLPIGGAEPDRPVRD